MVRFSVTRWGNRRQSRGRSVIFEVGVWPHYRARRGPGRGKYGGAFLQWRVLHVAYSGYGGRGAQGDYNGYYTLGAGRFCGSGIRRYVYGNASRDQFARYFKVFFYEGSYSRVAENHVSCATSSRGKSVLPYGGGVFHVWGVNRCAHYRCRAGYRGQRRNVRGLGYLLVRHFKVHIVLFCYESLPHLRGRLLCHVRGY